MNLENDLSYTDLLGNDNLFVHNGLNSQSSAFSTIPNSQEENVYVPSHAGVTDEIRRRRIRKTKFTSQEDLMLVSAWLNVSMDPITGTDQKHQTYWERVHAYYEEHRQFSSNRSPNSLMHRWSAILVSVNKFQGYMAQINSRHQSGTTEQDKICQAMEMYKELQLSSFPFIHCWKVLRNTEKFRSATSKKNTKKPQSSSSEDTPELINSEDNDSNEKECAAERPLGRKASKEILKKRRGKNDSTRDDTRNLLAEIIQSQKQQQADRKATTAEFIQIEKEREEREKKKEEREQMMYEQRILGTNTSHMDQEEAECFTSLKEAIIEKRRKEGFSL